MRRLRTSQHLTFAAIMAALAAPPAAAFAVALPTGALTLSTPTSTYNTLSMTVGFDPIFLGTSLGNQNETQSPTIAGSYSATFNALFNPVTGQATIQDVTLNLQSPGHISLQNEMFSGYSWVFGLETETLTTSGILMSPYTAESADAGQQRSVCRQSSIGGPQQRQFHL